MLEADEAYIRSRFSSAAVVTDPCPHLVIENLLPQPLYNTIERDIPGVTHWLVAAIAATFRRHMAAIGPAGLSRRLAVAPRALFDALAAAMPNADALELTQPTLDCNVPSRSAPGMYFEARKWRRRYLPAIQLVNSLVARAFEPHATEYNRQLVDAGIFADLQPQRTLVHEFCRRMRGWTIPPHTHDIGQAIQWMLYFPLPGSTEDQGTLFYRLTKSKTISAEKLGTSISFDSDEIEYCFTVPYRPNTLVAFLNTPLSVHGTVEIPEMVARRYFFVCNYWTEKAIHKDITVLPGAGVRAARERVAESV